MTAATAVEVESRVADEIHEQQAEAWTQEGLVD